MYLKELNITLGDLFLNYCSFLKPSHIIENYRKFVCYRRTYRNYIPVMLKILRKKYPIDAVMRDGTHVALHNILEAQIHGGRHMYGGRYKLIEYDISNDVAILSKSLFDSQDEVSIYGGITNGDITAIFVDNVYQDLPVQNKTVIDVGANIGDSAIYFALSGAIKVICLEPFPKNYELAQKNINSNNFSNNITLLLAGCSGNSNEIDIDPEYKSGNSSILIDCKKGIKVPLLTLEDILREKNLPADGSLILKMDCEGCEYDPILLANENTLRKFSHIMIEYHFGYKNLKEKLEKSGFDVLVTRPTIYWNAPDEFPRKIKFLEGYITAKRRL